LAAVSASTGFLFDVISMSLWLKITIHYFINREFYPLKIVKFTI